MAEFLLVSSDVCAAELLQLRMDAQLSFCISGCVRSNRSCLPHSHACPTVMLEQRLQLVQLSRMGSRQAKSCGVRAFGRLAEHPDDRMHGPIRAMLRLVQRCVLAQAGAQRVFRDDLAQPTHEVRLGAGFHCGSQPRQIGRVLLLLSRNRLEQNHRQLLRQSLGDGEAARLRHHDVGCGHELVHIVDEACHEDPMRSAHRFQPFLQLAAQLLVAAADEDVLGGRHVLGGIQQRQQPPSDQAVAPTHDENDRQGGAEPMLAPQLQTVVGASEGEADGHAGDRYGSSRYAELRQGALDRLGADDVPVRARMEPVAVPRVIGHHRHRGDRRQPGRLETGHRRCSGREGADYDGGPEFLQQLHHPPGAERAHLLEHPGQAVLVAGGAVQVSVQGRQAFDALHVEESAYGMRLGMRPLHEIHDPDNSVGILPRRRFRDGSGRLVVAVAQRPGQDQDPLLAYRYQRGFLLQDLSRWQLPLIHTARSAEIVFFRMPCPQDVVWNQLTAMGRLRHTVCGMFLSWTEVRLIGHSLALEGAERLPHMIRDGGAAAAGRIDQHDRAASRGPELFPDGKRVMDVHGRASELGCLHMQPQLVAEINLAQVLAFEIRHDGYRLVAEQLVGQPQVLDVLDPALLEIHEVADVVDMPQHVRLAITDFQRDGKLKRFQPGLPVFPHECALAHDAKCPFQHPSGPRSRLCRKR
ncbi:hypothetical protein BN871_EF_00040 [Paenibacillus sp. P22]|nr:hypothetical protein BN871_EF_00040 [Paenibacillus sp. P22]